MDDTTATLIILAVGLNTLLGAAITWGIVRAYYRLPTDELRAEAARLGEEAARLHELLATLEARVTQAESTAAARVQAQPLEAEVERLRAELEPATRPWWRRWLR